MDQAERKNDISARLRRAWNTALRAAEIMSVSPMEDLNDRIDRLEREVAMMKNETSGARTTRWAGDT
jgi:polyhydroxyalkanoate synthesis regulator phasin